MAQRLTTDAIRSLYPDDKWILLLPTVSKLLADDSTIYGLDVTEVEISPDSPSMVYDQNGKDALTKVALDKLASAAGITVRSRRTDDRSSRDYAAYEATAEIRNPGGEPIVRTANREWDGQNAADRILIECEKHVAKQSGLSDAQFDAAVQRRFREEMLREREVSRAQTETKAVNRSIAMILGIPRSFPRGVLATHKFAIAKYVLTPDMSDPDVKRAVLEHSFGRKVQLYGSRVEPSRLLGSASEPPRDENPEAAPFYPSEAVVQQQVTQGAVQRDDEIPQAVRDVQALLGARVLPSVGPEAGWLAVESLLPDITRMLAECRHAKATEAKARYLAAHRARDAAKVEAVYNWLLDQATAGGAS